MKLNLIDWRYIKNEEKTKFDARINSQQNHNKCVIFDKTSALFYFAYDTI